MIGRTSHTLKLQELGGFLQECQLADAESISQAEAYNMLVSRIPKYDVLQLFMRHTQLEQKHTPFYPLGNRLSLVG